MSERFNTDQLAEIEKALGLNEPFILPEHRDLPPVQPAFITVVGTGGSVEKVPNENVSGKGAVLISK